MKKHFTEEQLTAYALNELSSEERISIEEYLKNNKEAQLLLNEIQETLDVISLEMNKSTSQVMELSFDRKSKLQEYWSGAPKRTETKKSFWSQFRIPIWSVASVMSVALLVVVSINNKTTPPLNSQFAENLNSPKSLIEKSISKDREKKVQPVTDHETIKYFVADNLGYQQVSNDLGIGDQDRILMESNKGVSFVGSGGKMSLSVSQRVADPRLKSLDVQRTRKTHIPIKKSILKISVKEGPKDLMPGVKEQYKKFLVRRGHTLTQCAQKYLSFRNVNLKWKLNKSQVEGPIQVARLTKPHSKLELCLLHALKEIPRPELEKSHWDIEYQFLY